MKLLKKEMDRRSFLKYVLSGALVLGAGSFGFRLNKKEKVGFGQGVYGG